MSSDAAKIRSLSESFMRAVNEGDVPGWMATLTDDIKFMPPEQKSAAGSDAVRTWAVQNFFDPYDVDLKFSFDELEIGESWAYGSGPFREVLTPKGGGERLELVGKFIDVFRRNADGEWRFARVIFNTDHEGPKS